MQGPVETLQSYICYSDYFIQLLESRTPPPDKTNPHHIASETDILYVLIPSDVLPSLHEKDQVNFNSAPSQITIQQPTPIPTLPTFPHHPSNSARGD